MKQVACLRRARDEAVTEDLGALESCARGNSAASSEAIDNAGKPLPLECLI